MPRARNFYPAFIGLSFFPLPKSLKSCIINFLLSGTPDANHYLGQV
jgi:hypothetical protein